MCGAAAGLYRERREAAIAGGERSREGKGREEEGGGGGSHSHSHSRRASALGSVCAGLAAGGVAMASMAAAIAASRTAVMNGNRPLDERERKRFSYFSSLSPMARKIMAEKERIRERYGPEWERLPPRQQDEIIDKCLVEPHVQARYAAHRGAARPAAPPASYPSLRLNTGQKVVHFGDEVPQGQGNGAAGGARPAPLPSGPLAVQGGPPWRGWGRGARPGGVSAASLRLHGRLCPAVPPPGRRSAVGRSGRFQSLATGGVALEMNGREIYLFFSSPCLCRRVGCYTVSGGTWSAPKSGRGTKSEFV